MPRSMSRYSACNRNCYSMCSMDCNNLRSKAICTQFRSSRASICSWSKWDDMSVPGGQVAAVLAVPVEPVVRVAREEPVVQVVVQEAQAVVQEAQAVVQEAQVELVEEEVREEVVEEEVREEVVEERRWLRWQ